MQVLLMARKLPDGKVGLHVYISPRCKEKLDCLSQLYRSAGRKFALGDIVEESINFIFVRAHVRFGSEADVIVTRLGLGSSKGGIIDFQVVTYSQEWI